jgi:UDP-N-acetylglucosamine acyltransferase
MIHATAVIDPRAQIDPSVEVGPYAVIDGPAQIAAGCRIEAHAQIVGDVRIGGETVIGRAAVIGAEPQDLSFDPSTDSGVIIGVKNVIREHVTIHRSSKAGCFTTLGDGNFLMVGCHFGHDVQAGDRNIIANAVLLAGHVHIGNNSFLGGGAVFHQFVRIGDYCIIQGNSSFGTDVPHYCAGFQTNLLAGLNVVGLRRAGFTSVERAEIKKLFQSLFLSGRNLTQAVATAREEKWSDKAARMLEFVEVPTKRGIARPRGNADGEVE